MHWNGTTLRALGIGCALAAGIAGCGPRHDDASITRDVQMRIGDDRNVVDPAIAVTTTSGDVVLTGTVRSAADRVRVEEIARDVPGVKAVVNHVQVASAAPPPVPASPPPAVSAPPPPSAAEPGAAEDLPSDSDAPRPSDAPRAE